MVYRNFYNSNALCLLVIIFFRFMLYFWIFLLCINMHNTCVHGGRYRAREQFSTAGTPAYFCLAGWALDSRTVWEKSAARHDSILASSLLLCLYLSLSVSLSLSLLSVHDSVCVTYSASHAPCTEYSERDVLSIMRALESPLGQGWSIYAKALKYNYLKWRRDAFDLWVIR